MALQTQTDIHREHIRTLIRDMADESLIVKALDELIEWVKIEALEEAKDEQETTDARG